MGTLSALAVVASPYLLGLFIGFAIAVLGVHRWFIANSIAPTADLLANVRRLGFQYLALGVLATFLASNLLAGYLHGAPPTEVMQHALWGLPFGLFFGARWMLRRGER